MDRRTLIFTVGFGLFAAAFMGIAIYVIARISSLS